MNVLLSGIVGSTAYGMAHADSDVDRLGVYACDTVDLHGLDARTAQESRVTNDPDVTLHEAAKWCRLALAGNPTVMELVWLPEHLYETRTPLGDELITLRNAFLSAHRVRSAYFGYATQQFRKLESRGDGTFGPDLARRTAKHARHLYRLLAQGYELWARGELEIELADPAVVVEFGEQVAGGNQELAQRMLRMYEDAFDRTPTKLPATTDVAAVQAWLHKVRREHYRPHAT